MDVQLFSFWFTPSENCISKANWVSESAVEYTTSFRMQVDILIGRTWRITRSSLMSKWRWIELVIMAIVTGLLWFQTPHQEDTIHIKNGFLFFLVASCFFGSVFSSLQSFPQERLVYIKEIKAAHYSPAAYFVSKTIVESPARLLMPSIYLLIIFPLVGVNPKIGSTIGLIFIIQLFELVGEAAGLLVGLMFLNVQEAVTVANLMCVFWMLLGGFYTDTVPWFADWAKYTSPFYYSYQACLQFDYDRTMPCQTGHYIADCYFIDEYGYYQVRTSLEGNELLAYLGVAQSVQFNCLILVLFLVVLRVFCFLALIMKRHNCTTEL
jgi:hypothetical protein